MVSIIIPAHNEQHVIGRLLTGLCQSGEMSSPQIIVICNGCEDDTAEIAESFGVHVVQIQKASKISAINVGDELAKGFPRFYVDADVVLNAESVRRICNVFTKGELLAASPILKMDCSRSSWVVIAYYNIWSRLPYTRQGMIGTGVYALSEEGRKRFGRFPDVIADDEYVRTRFRSSERGAVPDAVSVVTAPSRLSGLIKIKTRSRLGGYQLQRHFQEEVAESQKEKPYKQAFVDIVVRPWLWIDVVVYLVVNLVARWRARQQLKNDSRYHWERDDSSRV